MIPPLFLYKPSNPTSNLDLDRFRVKLAVFQTYLFQCLLSMLWVSLLIGQAYGEDEYTQDSDSFEEPHSKQTQTLTPFYKGRMQFGFSGGSSQFGDRSFFSLGLNGSYFFIDNFAFDFGFQAGFGEDLSVYQPSAGLTYYINTESTWFPYLGLVYERMMLTLDQQESVRDWGGARAGIMLQMSRSIWIGVGGRALQEFDCESQDECTLLQPDIQFSIAF